MVIGHLDKPGKSGDFLRPENVGAGQFGDSLQQARRVI
jgi:hypothetical protein